MHNVIPIVGSHINITPLLVVVTYFIMTNTFFNVENFLIWYIKILPLFSPLDRKNKYNLIFGHVIAYILDVKNNISYLAEPNYIPSHFTDHSFCAFYSKI